VLNFANTPHIEVDGLTSVVALAMNHGIGKVLGKGSIDFGTATNIALGDVTIDVAALNLGGGSGGANAVAKFVPPALATVTINSVNVQAQASSHGTGNARATASVDLEQAQLDIAGNVVVNALALGDPGHASALANLTLAASLGGLTVGGNVEVQANAVDSAGDAKVQALANLQAASGESGGIHIGGHFFDGAFANAAGTASANANVTLKSRHIAIDSSMSIVAHATNDGIGQVKSQGQVAFTSATSIDLAQVTIDVKALNKNSQGTGGALASANFSPTATHIHFTGLNLQAEASSNGGGNATANAIALLTQGSFSVEHDVVVNALAFTNGPSGNAIALSKLDLNIPVGSGGIHIGGNVDVTADAHATDPHNVFATADVAFHSEGAVAVKGNIDVKATASTNAPAAFASHVVANAELLITANVGGIFVGDTSFGFPVNGNVSVTAKESAPAGALNSAVGNVRLTAGSESADIAIAGNVKVTADATGGTEEAFVIAIASLQVHAGGVAAFGHSITVLGNATEPGTGAAFAGARTDIRASGSGVFVGGNITDAATLQGNDLGIGNFGDGIRTGFATALADIEAGNGAIVTQGVTVTANTLQTNPDPARFFGEEGSSAGAFAKLVLSAGSSVIANGPITVNALANVAMGEATIVADATGRITAGSGDVVINGPVRVRANVQAFGDFLSVDALANLDINAGHDIILPNVAVRAVADASGFEASGSALANLTLNASHNVSITGGGAFAGASANMPNDLGSSHVKGSADLLINAGHTVFINGDVGAAAVALGGGTGDVANAIVGIEAGNLGSGDVTMFGNLFALSFADPVNDHALASITVNAQNDIFIVGHDPIASAHGGGAFAFLQTHFTDSTQHFAGSGSSAIARITIRAGGLITFLDPFFQKDERLALLALPTHQPNLNPNTLTEIQLLIDGQDCGVLGSAGADPNKAAACTKGGGINIPPGSDSLP
jgi:hypothetical protein